MIASFSPDFYLPDFDLYIELTTMSQKLVTKKNRKVRRLRELYPDVQHQDLLPAGLPEPAVQVRHPGPGDGRTPTAEALARRRGRGDRVSAAAARPSVARGARDRGAASASAWPSSARGSPPTTPGREPVLVTVLRGGVFFLADLCRAIDLPRAPRLHGGLQLRCRRRRGGPDHEGPRRRRSTAGR